MDTALRVVGIVLLLVSIAGIVVALRVLRRELPVRPKYDAIRLAIALGSALLITAVLSIGTPGWLVAGGLGLGLVLGVLQGRAMKIRVASDGVFGTRTTASVVTWGAGMVLAQGAGIANRVGFAAVGLAVAYMSAGMAGGLILGRNQAIETARRTSAAMAVAAIVLVLAAAPLVPFTVPAYAQSAEEFDLEVEIFLIAGAEQATLDGSFTGVFELDQAATGEVSGSFFGDLNCFQNEEIIGGVTVSGDVTYDVSGEQSTNDVGESVLAVTLTGRGTVNGVATAPEDNCQAQADDVTAGIGSAVMTFEFDDASFATQDVEFQAGVTTLGATGTIDRVPPPTLPPTTRPRLPDLPEDDFDADDFSADFGGGSGSSGDAIDSIDDVDVEIADALDLSGDAQPGEAVGAALVGLVGVAGLLASSLAEAGMSASDALRTRHRDDDWPPGPPNDPGGAPPPPPPPPTPSTPGAPVDAPIAEPPPAPEPDAMTLEFRTADVASDVLPDAPPPGPSIPPPPPPPPAPPIDVSPDVTPDAPPPPAPATPSAAADVPTAPPPDVDSAAGTVGSALREALRASGSGGPPGAALGDLLADVAPSGPGLTLAPEGTDAGIGSAVDRVTAALADRSSLTPATISIDEAVIATGTSTPTSSFDPLAGVDPTAGEFASDPAAFARSLLGDAGVEALGDTNRPLGESVGSRLFPVDVGVTDADALAAPAGPPPASDTTELVGDIAEDSAEVIADVVEDRGLTGVKQAATRSGQHADRDRDADPEAGWTTHELSPALREQLGLPDLPLPIRTDRAADVLGDPIDLPGLVGEIDAYLRSHHWAQPAYGDTIALLAHISGVARGRAGDHATALSLFSTGLDYSRDNLSLHANQALALQCLGRHHEAAAAYESLLATPGVRRRSLVGLVAARAYTDAGDENAARALLEEMSQSR